MTDNQKKVLDFIEKNAEATYDQIAEGVRLQRSSVQLAIGSLEKKKIITRSKARWMKV
jgi:predicted transcriptional regulator